jgi:hypothetical protein
MKTQIRKEFPRLSRRFPQVFSEAVGKKKNGENLSFFHYMPACSYIFYKKEFIRVRPFVNKRSNPRAFIKNFGMLT